MSNIKISSYLNLARLRYYIKLFYTGLRSWALNVKKLYLEPGTINVTSSDSLDNATIPQTHFWVVDVVVLAGGPDYQLPGFFDRVSIRSYLVKNFFNPGQSKMLFLSFRVHDMMQVQSLREVLYDTGIVTQINFFNSGGVQTSSHV